MLLETGGKHVRAVATDGHRLALCQAELEDARGKLAGYKVPRDVVFTDELPRTATGKLRRGEL